MANAPAAHVDVDPVTTRKLREFGSRRRRLIVLRGVCAAVISLIAVMSLIALVDYLFILTDQTRWILSVVGYLIVAVVVWRTCVRMIMHIPSERELARLVESTEPTLREDLVSAVELGAPESDARYDSSVFRQLLQDDVAGRMRNLDIESHLPWALVRRWIQVAVVVLVVCLILLALPGGRFRLPLMRAMLPGANLDRYSQVQVTVLAPQPADKTVPQSEPIQVLVQLEGPDTERVMLEAFHPDKGRQRVRMNPRGQRQFAVHVDVGRDPVQYRVLAGDAVTRRYTITPFPRPYVTAFRKTYEYPQYTRLDPRTVTEAEGDLSAFEKTTVRLQLDTDQPVESGELRIDQGGKKITVPLEIDAQKRLIAQVPIDRSGTYQVHLVSARTEFINKFSPTYEITARADLVPRVEIIEPAKSVLLPPDEIVGLRGRAEDDLGLAKIEQWIRVNNRRPVYVPLAEEAGTERLVARNWDLLPLKLKPGDRIITKLEAVDLKGNRATSQPLQVTVTAPGFDARRHAQLQAKLDVLAQINRLANQARESAASGSESIDQIRKSRDLDLTAQQYLTNAIASAQTLADQSQQTLTFVTAALPRVGKGSDAHDIMMAARLVAQTQHVHARLAGAGLAAASRTIDADDRGRQLEPVRRH
ncbi:MAG: hypothetical protein OER86_08530, partial [Phycisphaerae bacterium]|nr:hypothetical protein [Phycisphaerae bacterium]